MPVHTVAAARRAGMMKSDPVMARTLAGSHLYVAAMRRFLDSQPAASSLLLTGEDVGPEGAKPWLRGVSQVPEVEDILDRA